VRQISAAEVLREIVRAVPAPQTVPRAVAAS
jgi:hypothetical protein